MRVDSYNTVSSTGAKYNSSAGDFMWADDTSIDFNAWKKGEPRWGLDCAILMNHQKWGTDSCSSKRPSVCKIGKLSESFNEKKHEKRKGDILFIDSSSEADAKVRT